MKKPWLLEASLGQQGASGELKNLGKAIMARLKNSGYLDFQWQILQFLNQKSILKKPVQSTEPFLANAIC